MTYPGWEDARTVLEGQQMVISWGKQGQVEVRIEDVDGRKAKGANYTLEQKREWQAMLAHIAAARGYKPGYAAVKYKEKFGDWPQGPATPIPLSQEVLSWVRSRNIAYAKARSAAPQEI